MERISDSGSTDPSITIRRMRLTARIISVPIILFILLFFIANFIGPDYNTVEDYPPIENLLPVLVILSVISLGFAWRWELIGSLLCLILFASNLLLFWLIRGYFFPLQTFLPLSPIVLCGILFLLIGIKTGKTRKT
ncbi:MAG: hypothetical protein JXA25_11525 [Anaerolineales bacterium]|nr:hypothetical protein [Anaerolineales bacterium]